MSETSDVATLWSGRAVLGEGPVWDPGRRALWFVDIKQHRVHLYNPVDGSTESWQAPSQVGWVAPAVSGKLLAGLQAGIARFDPKTGDFAMLAAVDRDLPHNRLNDATVAGDGSILFGTMDDLESDRTGRFYRWDGQSVRALAIEPVCITNGPAVSPDHRTLYHIDSVGRLIHASAIDEDGHVEGTRVFARIDPSDGHPDGCTIDAAGNLWVGLWGGWRARLYAPDGTVLREVRLPCANVTKVALGGPDMCTAYVTTARAGLDDEALSRQPEAGNLFSFEVEVPGIPAPLALD